MPREWKDPAFELDHHMDYPVMHHRDRLVYDNYAEDPDYFRFVSLGWSMETLS